MRQGQILWYVEVYSMYEQDENQGSAGKRHFKGNGDITMSNS
jgi:hypothetical protein